MSRIVNEAMKKWASPFEQLLAGENAAMAEALSNIYHFLHPPKGVVRMPKQTAKFVVQQIHYAKEKITALREELRPELENYHPEGLVDADGSNNRTNGADASPNVGGAAVGVTPIK